MDRFLYPKHLAVIGVSEKPDNLGRHIAENILRFGYQGQLYLVGRQKGQLQGLPILDSIDQLPDGIDLAVMLTPAATIPGYLEQCGQKGILQVVIETAGFSEFSAEGKVLEEQLGQIAQRYGIRIIGPNCIGIINTDSGICTVFVKVEKSEFAPGRTSFMAQSGGVVLTVGDMLTAAGIGVGKAISLGNKLNQKEPDYLRYFLNDPATDICLMYLESIDQGRGLMELAGQLKKPLIVYKSNTGQASHRVAQSHTAALANDDAVVSAAFRQFGITRALSFRELVLYCKGFSMPPVRNNQLCVFSRSGGHAIISTDSATRFGFDLAPFPDSLLEKARPYFRADIIDSTNPLDLGTVFNFDSYPILIEECLRSVQPGAVMLVFNYRRETNLKAREIAAQLKELSQKYATPIALVYFAEMEELAYLEKNLGYPVFLEVIDAVQALAASRDFYQLQQRAGAQSQAELGEAVVPPGAREKALSILGARKGGQPLISDALTLLEVYGIPVAPWALAQDAAEAAHQAKTLGYPLALKAVSESILHKSDLGGVALNIGDEADLLARAAQMQQKIESKMPGARFQFLLQKMVSGGREVILGGKRDPSFGPLLLFGLGGIYVEVFKDAAIRLAPVQRGEVKEMIREIQGSALLSGTRGQAGVDLPALEDALLKLSQMLVDLPEVKEIDINPVLAFAQGVVAVDARVILG